MKLKWLFNLCCISVVCIPYPGYLGKAFLRAVDLFVVGIAASSLVILIVKNRYEIERSKTYLVFIAVFIIQFISIFNSDSSVSLVKDLMELYKVITLIFVFGVGVMSAKYISDQSVNNLLLFLFVYSTCIALLQVVFGPSVFMYFYSARPTEMIDAQYGARVIGTMGNPNYFALLNIGFFFWSLSNFVRTSSIVYGAALFFSFMLILFSQSRTGITVFFLILPLAYFLVSPKITGLNMTTLRSSCTFFFLFVFMSSIILYVFMFSNLGYLTSGYRTVYDSGLTSQSSFHARLVFWEYFYELIKEKPLFGYGPSKDFFMYNFADNNYIYTTFKYGLVGLVVILALWFSVLLFVFRAVRAYDLRHGVFALFFGLSILLTSFMAETMDGLRVAPLFFLISGLICGRLLLIRRDFHTIL